MERKKIGEESKTPFPIFKSVNDVEGKCLQNHQLESNENKNQCEKTIELSWEIDIHKTATYPYDVATEQNHVSLSTKFMSLQKTIDSNLELFVGQEERLIQNGWKNSVGYLILQVVMGVFVRSVLYLVMK